MKEALVTAKEIVMMPVGGITPYARNSRTHSDEQVSQIAASISEWGFTNPILVDSDGKVIAGHGRLMAAQRLGMSEVPTICCDGWSDTQLKAYVIADNKLALNAGWDSDLLHLELSELEADGFDLELTGFDIDEINALNPEQISEGLTDEDATPEVQPNPITVEGDVWVMGKHRLMCGDSTSIDAVDTLMDGNSVEMIFTDPPYNVAFNGRSGKHDVIKNDDMDSSDFSDFIGEVCNTIKALDPAVYYVWCNWKFYGDLQGRLPYRACIVWAKNVFGLGRGYRHQHEFCLFNGNVDEEVKNESDLWSIKKDTNYAHPTQKPVALSVRAFGNHIKLTKVLDLFGGSGSTLIGAEQTGRTAFLMELDPKYCDVIVKRWQDFTGQSAHLESSGSTFEELSEKRSQAA